MGGYGRPGALGGGLEEEPAQAQETGGRRTREDGDQRQRQRRAEDDPGLPVDPVGHCTENVAADDGAAARAVELVLSGAVDRQRVTRVAGEVVLRDSTKPAAQAATRR